MLDKFLELKTLVKDSLPKCRVLTTIPTFLIDDEKAQIMVTQLTRHLLQLKIDTINNNYTNVKHLGGKGLHLNQSDSKLLSNNFEKPKDVQISRITDLLILNIFSHLSLAHQVGEAAHP